MSNNLIDTPKIKIIYFLRLIQIQLKLSAVRKVLETLWFLALGSFESKTVRGTVLA